MPDSNQFHLSATQQERLLACRAAWEEGEDEERLERLRQREEDTETLRAIAWNLADADFAQGGDLTRAQMAHLLILVRALAPNPNLDARLLRQPDEPGALNRDLRDLLFGPAEMPLRLRGFLQRRHAGAQTALQLLCAAFPTEWPLVTQAGLRALSLTPEQRTTARTQARRRFALLEEPVGPEARQGVPDSDPVLRLLADVVIYTAVRELLEAADFVIVHRLLTQGLDSPSRRIRQLAPPLLYAPRPEPLVTALRESSNQEYEAAESSLAEPSALLAAPPDISGVSEQVLLAFLERSIAAQGFTYPPLIVRDYYISLQTKPYVWLLGSNGVGKTRLTSLFAAALTDNLTEQYRLIPVRPDWADSTPLLGYVNLLAGGGEGRYVTTPFLEFLRHALRLENAQRAFLLCLDEMNLARVEHYFAEALSAMETPTRQLLLPDGRALRLPDNLFLTGTLNTDEAAHPLTRKVLDRANTLSLTTVCLRTEESEAPESRAATEGLSPAVRQAVFLRRRVTDVAAARAKLRQITNRDLAAVIVDRLVEVNALLEPQELHFAYRVRDEVLCYCANSFDSDGSGLLTPDAPQDVNANLHIALDFQLLQKVLPRLSGTQEFLEPLLRDLQRWAEKARFPRTAQKLGRLLMRLQRDGFVSFD
jgi:hypothetical protein